MMNTEHSAEPPQHTDEAKAYWQEALRGFSSATSLGLERRDGDELAAAHAVYEKQQVSITRETTDALRAFAQHLDVNAETLVDGAWAVLLSRYSREAEVLFGTVVKEQTISSSDAAPGLKGAVKALPLKVGVDGGASVSRWVQEVQERREAMRRYADVSLAQVQMWNDIPPVRATFESIVAFDETGDDVAGKQEAEIETGGSVWLGGVDCPLVLVGEMREEWSLRIVYDRSRFSESAMRRVAGHLQTLLEAMPTHSERRVSELPLLTEAEKEQLIEWNNTRFDYREQRCLHEIFEEQVERTPDASALGFEGEYISYRELNNRANQLAHHLRSIGVGVETLVGLCIERSFEMMVGLFGILKAGGAYVPLDPGDPPERLSFMIEDTGVRVLLTQGRLLDVLPAHTAQVVCLDTDWMLIAGNSTANPSVGLSDKNMAYVIYTSGSTGRPKGAMNTHGAVRNRLMWTPRVYTLTPADNVMQKTPFSFDVSVCELFWPLMMGARLVLAKPEGHRDAEYLAGLIEREQITMIHFVPSMLNVFLAEADTTRCASLKYVVCSGEALPHELQERFYTRLDARLYNLYGPTEAAVEVTGWTCARGAHRHVVPIGWPIDNVQIHLLDEEMQPAPVGVSGELHIAGVAVARGYWHRPDVTAEKFIPDPFSTDAGARMYRTGDLARRLDDGEIEYVGRIDFQMKVRGYRIEAGELEAVLCEHAGIREAAVTLWADAKGEKRLVAYVVLEAEADVLVAEIRNYLAGKLPEYMVPTIFVMLEKMPLTQSGKVNRKELPAPDFSKLKTDYVAPRTPVERTLTAIWVEVLGVEEVGVNDDFFSLGGHSLLAAMIISRIRNALHVELPQRIFFESPTLAQLAQRIEEMRRASDGAKQEALTGESARSLDDLSTDERMALAMRLRKKSSDATPEQRIPRRKDTGAVALSFAQQRLWFLDRMDSGNSHIIPVTAQLTGHLDVAALESSLNEIVRRHEALRTTFTSIDNQPVQVITPQLTLTIPALDVSGLPDDERAQELRRLRHEVLRPFDLERGPLVRASLVRVSEDEHLLLLAMNHIVSDGWSLGVMIGEMATLYEAFVTGQEAHLPKLPIQYADFAVWQREWLSAEVMEGQLAYWKEQLGDSPAVLELPTDRPRPPVQSYQGSFVTWEIGKELTESLKELSRHEGVTLYMTMLAAFKTLLAWYSGQDKIIVGTPIANRNWMEIENLIGFFVNTLVLRTDLSGNPTFSELLARVREVTLGAYAHQDVPFEKLVEELQPERTMSHTPLFQVMFSLQNAPMPPLELTGVTMKLLDDESTGSQFDLTLDLTEQPDSMLCLIEYNSDIFDHSTAQRILGHFQNLLASIVVNPQQRLRELPLLSEAERRQLLVEWNDTARDYPQERCIHQLFEQQSGATPDAVAVVFDGEPLSFRELNSRANRLAHHLRELGVEPEVRVGILLERSTEMPVALLGVLKAGGAYVALDPAYPPERLRYMLADAGVAVLLTQERLLESIPEYAARVVCVDAAWSSIAQHGDQNVESGACAENLAYLVYTSGTTGQPKGILVEHRSLVNAIHAFITTHAMTQDDRLLQFASLSFDVAAEEFFSAWLSGACAVMRPAQAVATHEEFVSLLDREKITVVNLPASFWSEWLAALAEGQSRLPERLRRVVVGNEKTMEETLARWRRTVAGRVAWSNAYGPTETTITASNFEPSTSLAARGASSSVPIGRPVMNAEMYVLDASLQLVPVGVAGELYIGGAGVARGYHGQAGQTAERFVPHPYSVGGGARLYRTGDVARYVADGNVEFVGRVDEQVKIRGFRVEVGEIESVLAQHEGVRESVVMAREDGRGGHRLVAYVVSNNGSLTTGELRGYLGEKLPEYMLPSAFVTLESLPLTPNGKIDRRALPNPDGARPEMEETYIAPRSTMERAIADIWQEVLGVEKVGVNDNFFGLGGHSLLLVHAHSRVREALNVNISMVEMFKYPTVSALACHLSQAPASASVAASAQTRTQAGTRIEALSRQRQLRQRVNKKR